MKQIFFYFFILAGFSLQAQKPIIDALNSAPSVRVFGKSLWIYPSNSISGDNSQNLNDWRCYSSEDLETWTEHGVIFGLNRLAWADKSVGSSDCIKENGKYYFYFTADSQIGVGISSSPSGPFIDEVRKPLIAKDNAGNAALDPNVFIDDDGQPYLLFAQGALYIAKLNSNLIMIDDIPVKLSVKNFSSGAWIHKRKGIYYLTYSSTKGANGTNLLEYSMSNSPYGPWYYKGKILDDNFKNGQHSIVEFKEKWYLFHDAGSGEVNKHQLFMEPLEYNADGTIKKISLIEGNAEVTGAFPTEKEKRN
jgi:beta-xylosidase